MIDELDLLPIEKWWINSRGGRNYEDVFLDDEKRKYINMADKRGMVVKKYIPDPLSIKEEMNYHG